MKAPLTVNTVDEAGHKAADFTHWSGEQFQHYRNGKLYRVDRFVWMGETDLWGILHHCVSDGALSVPCVRSIDDFRAFVYDKSGLTGSLRFTHIPAKEMTKEELGDIHTCYDECLASGHTIHTPDFLGELPTGLRKKK